MKPHRAMRRVRKMHSNLVVATRFLAAALEAEDFDRQAVLAVGDRIGEVLRLYEPFGRAAINAMRRGQPSKAPVSWPVRRGVPKTLRDCQPPDLAEISEVPR